MKSPGGAGAFFVWAYQTATHFLSLAALRYARVFAIRNAKQRGYLPPAPRERGRGTIQASKASAGWWKGSWHGRFSCDESEASNATPPPPCSPTLATADASRRRTLVDGDQRSPMPPRYHGGGCKIFLTPRPVFARARVMSNSDAIFPPPACGGEGRERSERGGGSGLKVPPTVYPSPPLASLAGEGNKRRKRNAGRRCSTTTAPNTGAARATEGAACAALTAIGRARLPAFHHGSGLWDSRHQRPGVRPCFLGRGRACDPEKWKPVFRNDHTPAQQAIGRYPPYLSQSRGHFPPRS